VLVLARAQRKDGDPERARRTVRPLTTGTQTPESLLPEALLLHADCEFELGRSRDAERLYQRAASLTLSDEDASWAALQLGNLARRAGRQEEARRQWQSAAERYPDTFYAAQAAWFLRVSDAVEKLNQAQAEGSRG
jgi:tetratricopeptide (TPR) repeat protein